MNEIKQRNYWIESLIGLGATLVIAAALGLYILNESSRIAQSQADVLNSQLDEAMTLYAENCVVCHGVAGDGIGATPPLNNPALQTMAFEDIAKTIARGRYQTAMPAWSIEDGGPLSDYQIEELVLLVQHGDWSQTGDRVVDLGLSPLVPFATEPDPVLFAQVAAFPDGATLQNAIQVFSANCVSCHGADGLGTGIAPALNDTDTRDKTVDDLTRTLTFGNTGTLMVGWNNTLTADEISGLVNLIKRWEEIPEGTIPAPDIPVPTTEESIALGSQLLSANCSRCHGPEGQGTPRAPSLNVKSFLSSTNDQAMLQIITSGVPGTAMPAWGDRMTDAEIHAIVGFIRQWEPTAPEVAILTRPGGGGPPWRNNTTNNQSVGLLPSTSNTNLGASRQGTQSAQTLDWRILFLAGVILAIAFTLVVTGFSALRKRDGPGTRFDRTGKYPGI
jgi:mono/diheme cytochrome c family protein